MKTKLMLVAQVVLSIILATQITASAQTIAKHRLIVITDIGNEPDDFMSMVRLMLYTNQIDIEGLIASTSIHQSKKVSPQLIEKVIRSYEKVQPNLLKHEPGFPTAQKLLSLVRRRKRQRFGRVGLGDQNA
jgi:hypothetical protein